jgi:hypothetical protein
MNMSLGKPRQADQPARKARWRLEGAEITNFRHWLGDLDSNQGCPGQSREFYR